MNVEFSFALCAAINLSLALRAMRQGTKARLPPSSHVLVAALLLSCVGCDLAEHHLPEHLIGLFRFIGCVLWAAISYCLFSVIARRSGEMMPHCVYPLLAAILLGGVANLLFGTHPPAYLIGPVIVLLIGCCFTSLVMVLLRNVPREKP